jgi:RNA polymerase sigma-70 factor (ECF subfamily)
VKSRLHRARVSVRERIAPILGIRPDLPKAPGVCPDALTMYEQLLEHEISAELCAQLEQHLANCERCRGVCASLEQTLVLCRDSATATAVPGPVQSSVRTALRTCLAENA